METKSNKEFEYTIALINKIMSVSGHNVLDANWSKGIKKKCLCLVVTLATWFLPIMCITGVLHHLHDFVQLSESVLTVSSCAQTVFKLLIIQMSHKDLRGIVDRCREFRIKFAEEIEIERSTSVDSLLIRKPALVIKISYVACNTAAMILLFKPFLKEERSFPLLYYFPFCSPIESPCYEFNYAYVSVFSLFLTMHTVFALDSIFIFLISEMCLQFNVIRDKLSKIGKFEENKYEDQIIMIREIQELTQGLSESIKEINKIFSIASVIQCFSAFGMITVTLFKSATSSATSEIILLFCIVAQILFYCLYGEFIKHRMESLTFILYNNEWYNLKIKERKSLMMMMSYSQNVTTLKAGGYAELSLATYMQILKTAYTYFAIMKDQVN